MKKTNYRKIATFGASNRLYRKLTVNCWKIGPRVSIWNATKIDFMDIWLILFSQLIETARKIYGKVYARAVNEGDP